jgi:hypothetical protein
VKPGVDFSTLVSKQTTFETSQTDTQGIGSARSLRLKNSSQKKPSQYCDTALMSPASDRAGQETHGECAYADGCNSADRPAVDPAGGSGTHGEGDAVHRSEQGRWEATTSAWSSSNTMSSSKRFTPFTPLGYMCI